MDESRRRFLARLVELGFSVAAVESLLLTSGCSSVPNPQRALASTPKSLSDSICIVGAGASGIATAYYLKAKGYTNVTVFEASDHLGGKCNTIQLDGRAYDMGAVFTTSSYDEVKRLASEFKVDVIPLQGLTHRNIVNVKTGVARTRSETETVKLGAAAIDYFRALKRYPHLIQSGFTKLHPDLYLPLSEWMKQHSFFPHALDEFFGFTFTPFGYGFTDEVPAAYALKYYEQRLVSSLLSGHNLGMIKQGYQSLWEAVAAGMNVQLNTPVLKVHRSTTGPVLVETQKSSAYFDHLIITTLPEDTLKFLDATLEEKNDLQKVNHYFYYTVAVDLPPGFAGSGFLPDNYVQSKSKHPLCWFKRWDDADIAIFYALAKTEVSHEDITATLLSDADHYGWNLGKVRAVKRWKYFPHFKSEHLASGIYDRLEARQGQMNTFIAGEIMNFSTVELVTRYAKDLVLRFFA